MVVAVAKVDRTPEVQEPLDKDMLAVQARQAAPYTRAEAEAARGELEPPDRAPQMAVSVFNRQSTELRHSDPGAAVEVLITPVAQTPVREETVAAVQESKDRARQRREPATPVEVEEEPEVSAKETAEDCGAETVVPEW